MKKFTSRFKGLGRQGQVWTNALKYLARATVFSQRAEKLYWDMKINAPRSDADYDKALKLLDDGIHMLDQVVVDFPTTVGAVLPIKQKLILQKEDIEKVRKGVIDEILPKVPF